MEELNQQNEDKKIELAGVVFNSTTDYYPEELKAKNEVKSIAKKYGWYVFDAEIPFSRSYPKGAREGRPISLGQFKQSSPTKLYPRT